MITFEMEELMPIVSKLIVKYTSNESTSVSYEKARQLMEAVLFCIHEADDTLSIENSIVTSNMSAEEVYNMGYKCVQNKVKAAMKRYHTILDGFHAYGNIALQDTMIEGMPAFFRYYDVQFQPQNTILTLDYLTLRAVDSLQGIDAVYQYLLYIELEQKFLRAFPISLIEESLRDYHVEYEELFINLPSIVLRYVMKTQFGSELETIKYKEQKEIQEWLTGVIRILVREQFQDDKMLFAYLCEDAKEYACVVKMGN